MFLLESMSGTMGIVNSWRGFAALRFLGPTPIGVKRPPEKAAGNQPLARVEEAPRALMMKGPATVRRRGQA